MADRDVFPYVDSGDSDAAWGQKIQGRQYWDERYAEDFANKRGAFEWYVDFESLSALLATIVKKRHRVLEVGCGNSTLGRDLRAAGYESVTCIDFSPVVISQQESGLGDVDGLKFITMDASHMSFENETFECVLDKATLDAMLSGNLATAKKLVAEVCRVLCDRGTYVIVSHVSPESDNGQKMINNVLVACLDWEMCQWRIDIHSVWVDNDDESSGPHVYCVQKFVRPRTRNISRGVLLGGVNNIVIKQHFH